MSKSEDKKAQTTRHYAEEALGATLDVGIAKAVEILRSNGVETFESCEGGEGHPFPEPTIRFHGNAMHALGVAMVHVLPVSQLRRTWDIEVDWPTAPCWELVFYGRVKKIV